MSYVVATYLARFAGILILIPGIFPEWFMNWFPGLEDRRISWVFFAVGIAIYAGASIVYRVFYKRELARRHAERERV